ncbi:Beta-glucanase [Pontiella desulfatans]|uniref:Beta-glucanase n=2 Tax=Pontiella desulfatans TaxID=2750659 RepID=A0A6C2U5U9_PONDE|nr:Beta-glucanase [Pontiella desulfatans]
MGMKITTFMCLASTLLAPVSQGAPGGYALVWADEFNVDGRPDPANWTYEHGHSRNHEAQWYQPENAWCTNGFLVIEARRERVPNPGHKPGSKDWRKQWDHANYTSACLITRGLHSWQYGRFEMRAKIDTRAGLWPAFWTLGNEGDWPTNGEVDIMEYYQDKLLANVIWGAVPYSPPKHKSVKTPLAKLGEGWADDFHLWRMDWDEEHIRLYVDDRLLNETKTDATRNPGKGRIEHPFGQPHYILLNLAIHGTCGGDPAATEFPARFEVDYVRVYQKQNKDHPETH